MADKLEVPETLKMTFKRVLQRVPADRRDNIKIQKNILLFLKLGGERLARARIKPIASPFPGNISVVKPRPLPVVVAPVVKAVVDNKNPTLTEEDKSPEEQD